MSTDLFEGIEKIDLKNKEISLQKYIDFNKKLDEFDKLLENLEHKLRAMRLEKLIN